jgi:hypothetical protein
VAQSYSLLQSGGRYFEKISEYPNACRIFVKVRKLETCDWREQVEMPKAAPVGASGVGTPEFNGEQVVKGTKPLG